MEFKFPFVRWCLFKTSTRRAPEWRCSPATGSSSSAAQTSGASMAALTRWEDNIYEKLRPKYFNIRNVALKTIHTSRYTTSLAACPTVTSTCPTRARARSGRHAAHKWTVSDEQSTNAFTSIGVVTLERYLRAVVQYAGHSKNLDQ